MSSKYIISRVGLLFAIALAPFFFVYFAIKSQYKTHVVSVHNVHINVQIATSSQEKARGLCCREKLPENSGMLFVYKKPGNYRFWMKDTKIPLDIYWIDSQKKVVHIEPNVRPESYPNDFGTNIPSNYVLETNAGFAEAHKVHVGDQIKLPL